MSRPVSIAPGRTLMLLERWPRQVAAGWFVLALLGILLSAACQRGVPIIRNTDQAASQAAGTISGTIRGPRGSVSADSRTVQVVNVVTGETQRVTSTTGGGFSCRLKPGKYRIELSLRAGESLVRQPGIIDLERADGDTHADFELGPSRVTRPRGPAYRTDDGLGSPIA